MKFKKRLPLGVFSPDSRDLDTPALDVANNVLPLFGSYRTLQKASQITQETTTTAINGSMVHVVTEGVARQIARPASTTAAGDWVSVPGEATDDLHEKLDEIVRDDNDYISWRENEIATSTKSVVELSSVDDPVVHTGHILRFAARGIKNPLETTNWTLKADLIDNGSASSVKAVTIGTLELTDVWIASETTLATGDAAKISDYSDLSIEFTADITAIPGGSPAPDQELDPVSDFSDPDNWDSTSSTLYEAIDDGSSPSSASYINTQSLGSGESSHAIVGITQTGEDPITDTGYTVYYRYKADFSGCDLTVTLMQGETEIASEALTDIATTITDGSFNLSAAEADSITDHSNLRLKFEFTNTTAGGGDQELVPVSQSGTSDWKRSDNDNATNTHAMVDDTGALASDTDYVYSVDGATYDVVKWNLDTTGVEPSDHSGTRVVVGLKAASGSGKVNILLQTTSGATIAEARSVNVGSTASYKYLTLSESQSQGISNWGALRIRLEKRNTTDWQCYCYQARIETAGSGSTGYIYNAYMGMPEAYGVDVSWAEFEVPSATTETLGDKTVIYAGNVNSIYKVTPDAFTDMSKGGSATYASGTTNPQAWDFCSWGDDPIATNYVDPVQFYDTSGGGSAWADLISSTDQPKARFCSVIGEHLALANITNVTDMGEYTFWISGINDPTHFAQGDLTTLSDYQHIRSTPGAITGMVGGEYGTVFKRNSIHRISMVGPPQIFTVHELSITQGTAYPRSIVKVDNDIYFFGNGGFWVIPGGNSQPVPIGDGHITKMFIDTLYDTERAIIAFSSDSQIQLESALVGSYVPSIGLVGWLYRVAGDTVYQNGQILWFNPKENRWTLTPVDSSTHFCEMTAKLNTLTEETSVTQGLVLFNFDGTDTSEYVKFNSNSAYGMELKTKIQSAVAIVGSEKAIGQNLFIRSVRPLFRGQPTASTDPELTLTIEASDDSLMLPANVTTVTLTKSANRNRDGWYRLDERVEGEYFTFKVVSEELPASGVSTPQTIKDFLGLEVDGEWAGEV